MGGAPRQEIGMHPGVCFGAKVALLAWLRQLHQEVFRRRIHFLERLSVREAFNIIITDTRIRSVIIYIDIGWR